MKIKVARGLKAAVFAHVASSNTIAHDRWNSVIWKIHYRDIPTECVLRSSTFNEKDGAVTDIPAETVKAAPYHEKVKPCLPRSNRYISPDVSEYNISLFVPDVFNKRPLFSWEPSPSLPPFPTTHPNKKYDKENITSFVGYRRSNLNVAIYVSFKSNDPSKVLWRWSISVAVLTNCVMKSVQQETFAYILLEKQLNNVASSPAWLLLNPNSREGL